MDAGSAGPWRAPLEVICALVEQLTIWADFVLPAGFTVNWSMGTRWVTLRHDHPRGDSAQFRSTRAPTR